MVCPPLGLYGHGGERWGVACAWEGPCFVAACDEHMACAGSTGELDSVTHDAHSAAVLGWEMRFGEEGVIRLGVEEDGWLSQGRLECVP